MACCCAMDMGNTAVLAASVALKGWWRDWSDWQWNDRQSQSFCLSFKVIFRSKKPLILDVIVIVIGNFVIVTPVCNFVTGDVTGEDFVTGDFTITAITGDTVTADNSA